MPTAPHNAASFLTRRTVDPVRGFLPSGVSSRPRTRSSGSPSAFEAWEELTAELPRLLCAGRLRRAIHDLPLLDATQLEGAAKHDRAMLLLSYLGHAYVFGEKNPCDAVPEPIARPWHHVATVLDRPPVLSYASHALANWRRPDRLQPVGLYNIARLENFLEGVDENWFVLVHIAIEALAGPDLMAAVAAQDAVTANDPFGRDGKAGDRRRHDGEHGGHGSGACPRNAIRTSPKRALGNSHSDGWRIPRSPRASFTKESSPVAADPSGSGARPGAQSSVIPAFRHCRGHGRCRRNR
ncbi:hypothetical protein ACSNOK_07980 [Streptomyces sp. URMC 126]|uniref:hypothetical protein n=1 Tax=Streptomyces sp. URMC 126 TaxID=3423401 RepID=UPI003F198FCA